MLWVILVTVLIICVLQRRWLTRRQVAFAKQLKTKLKSYPIIGHSYMFIGTSEDRMKTIQLLGIDAIEAGGVSKFLHFNRLCISVADPAVAEVVLRQSLEKHDIMKIISFLIGNASIIAPVPIWRHRRKINAPTFYAKNLTQFVETFSKQSIAMADRLDEETDKEVFSVLEFLEVYSMNTVCETAMGVQLNFQGSEFFHALHGLWVIGAYVMWQPLFWTQFALKYIPLKLYNNASKYKRTVYDFITQIIREKQKNIHGKSNLTAIATNKMPSFLDLQLGMSDSTSKFSEQELLEEVLMLVVAGFDTTSTTAALIVVMLSRHPDIQDKVFEELQEVFGDSDRVVTYEDLPRLHYLQAVINETLRLYPIAPVLGRQVDKDVKLPSGITIVKECGIMINIWAVHRNPEYWGEDADQFRPERFLNYTPKHPAAFIPFSYGPRGCVGYRYAMLSLKTVLTTVVRRYRLCAPPGVALGEPLRTKYEMMLKHVDNYEIWLERRALSTK